MVKLSEIDLPVIFEKQLLFKAGNWNNWDISADEVNRSVFNTNWNKQNSSLIYSHKDKDAEAWAGNVKNIHTINGATYGDVHVYDPNAAVALKYGEAPFAISAGIAWPEKYDQPTNFFYRNFCLVADPGVRDKEIFLNFSVDTKPTEGLKLASFSNEKVEGGYRIANFSGPMTSEGARGSELSTNANAKDHRDEEEDKKKDKDLKDEKKADYVNTDERGFKEIDNMKTEKNVTSVEDRLNAIESKLANFEEAKPVEAPVEAPVEVPKEQPIAAPAEAPKEVPKEIPQETPKEAIPQPEPVKEVPKEPEKVVKAAPIMDDSFVDKMVNKLSERVIPALTPKPMTVQEFSPEKEDSTENAVEKLAKALSN